MGNEIKKIGIVTWFESENMGTNLQAYALYEKLHNLGYNVSLISYFRYRSWGLSSQVKNLLEKLGVLNFLRMNFGNAVSRKRKIRIYKFLHKNVKIERIYSRRQYLSLLERFNIFISGSDQIWNPNCLDSFYLLDFAIDKKKIAYASSIGVSAFPEDMKNVYSKYLGSYSYIGLRETVGVNMVNELLGINKAIKVVDPTFLLSSHEWRKLAKLSRLEYKCDFLFCYFIGNRKEYECYLKNIYSKFKYSKIIVFCSMENSETKFKSIPNIIYLKDSGMEDFVYLINQAKIVCTDSFHATAISINLKKDFVEFLRFDDMDNKSQNSRIIDLLGRYKLTDRIYSPSNIEWVNAINYQDKLEVLHHDIDASVMFLQQAIIDEK